MKHIKGMYYKPEKSFDSLTREKQIQEYIKSFREPAFNICSQLKEAFTAGKYSHIFGVDTSGRIPAVLVHEFSKSVAKNQGLLPPLCMFLPPNMETKRETEITSTLAEETQKRHVLVVDDTVMKAQSIFSATEILRDTGTAFDVAVFISYNLNKKSLALEAEYMEADNFYIGIQDYVSGADEDNEGKHPVKISSVNGVERLKGPIYFGSKETVILGNEDLQNEVNIARKAVLELARDISNELLS